MQINKLGIIGGGNMARSLIGGLIADGIDPASISVADPSAGQRAMLGPLNVTTYADNNDVIDSDVVVFAVKPQDFRDAASGVAEAVQARRPLIVSVAAGIRSGDVDRWLGGGNAIVRAMPNTPALLGAGVTALWANDLGSSREREMAESLLRAVGPIVWLDDESQMDTVTAVSGTGPAYFFLLMELIEAAAVDLGLPEDTASLLTLQTALGAARMAIESEEHAGELRRRVTSPGGTTAAALDVFENGNMAALVRSAIDAARDRSCELADQLGKHSVQEIDP